MGAVVAGYLVRVGPRGASAGPNYPVGDWRALLALLVSHEFGSRLFVPCNTSIGRRRHVSRTRHGTDFLVKKSYADAVESGIKRATKTLKNVTGGLDRRTRGTGRKRAASANIECGSR